MNGHSTADEHPGKMFKVVVFEEQYLIWPVQSVLPEGYVETDKIGTKEECSAYIKQLLDKDEPLFVRRKMEDKAQISSDIITSSK